MTTNTDALIYVVDDDYSAREAIVSFAQAVGFEARGFSSAMEFLAYPRPALPGCLVLDVGLPDISGLELQQQLKAENDTLPIIFVSGYDSVPLSVSAIRGGAVDFLTKPFDANGLLDAIQRAIPRPAPDAASPAHGADTSQPKLVPGIVGSSAPLRAMLDHVRAVAATDTTVLIQGESGSGKERVARALHDLSERAGGPFISVNCAAIPAALLESELMGHERGAFTGATGQRLGRFELAQDGTIFLDEIGELPLSLQPKLLRILQERQFERLGGSRTLHSNARVIAATHCDLRAMISDHSFREDLYYRLSVFPIEVPPLRERMEDIPLLAQHFATLIAGRMGRPSEGLSQRSLERLLNHNWPGNIRELQNVIERALILASDGRIEIPDLGESIARPGRTSSVPPPPRELDRTAVTGSSQGLAEVSKAHILRVLKETNWVIAGPRGAAARLEMKRTTLNFRMKKLGIVRRAEDESY
ncbi:MAG: sigma-54 dependent transcriptional regulator [Myxococcales bacterium]